MKPVQYLPIPWYIATGIALALGILFVCTNPQAPPWIQVLSTSIRSDSWAIFIGAFLICLVASHLLVFFAIRGLDAQFGLSGEPSLEDLWPPTWVGMIEGTLYPLALMVDKAEFIGIWLAVKVAGQWVRWGTGFPTPTKNERSDADEIFEAKKGRRRFNKFLVGSGLRILLGGLTYLILRAASLNM